MKILPAVKLLKILFFSLWCVSFSLWAADSPRVTVDQSPVGANKADIGFISTINGNNVMHVTISSGSQGCSAGQYWDIVVGGCTIPVNLRTESTSRACSCTCPEAGSCTSAQTGTFPVYGWRVPTAGTEQISGYGAIAWNACQVVTNACIAETKPAPAHPPGSVEQIIVADLVCDGSNPRFSQGAGSISQKAMIIQAYIDHPNGFGRCPEYTYAGYQGYFDWQGLLATTSIDSIVKMIKASPVPDSEVRKVVDLACDAGASAVYGSGGYVKAIYIMGSGNACQILF